MNPDPRPLHEVPWSEMADVYDATRAFPGDGEREVPAAVAARLRERGVGRLLEVGAGTGRFAVPLRAAGLRVVAADRSAEMLARLRAKPGGGEVHTVRCDALALPFRAAFDGVLFSHVLHLLEDVDAFAAALRPTLRPGATVALVESDHLPCPVKEAALGAVFARLGEPFTPWERGALSRDRRLLERVLAGLDATGDVEAVELATWPRRRSLREVLDAIGSRVHSTFRRWDQGTVAEAVEGAAADLHAARLDLEEERDEPRGVRLLLGTTGHPL